MAADHPRPAKREASSSPHSKLQSKKPKTSPKASEARGKHTSNKKSKTNDKCKGREVAKARSQLPPTKNSKAKKNGEKQKATNGRSGEVESLPSTQPSPPLDSEAVRSHGLAQSDSHLDEVYKEFRRAIRHNERKPALLTKLPEELIEKCLPAWDTGSMFAVVTVCKKLWRIGIQLLDVDMHLFLDKTHPCLRTEDWQALVLRMLAFARYIRLIVKSDESGQLRAQEILRSLSLAQRPLKALLFDDGMCPKNDPSTNKELIVSTLSRMSWSTLAKIMQNSAMTSKLEEVRFPEYDWKTISKLAEQGHDPTLHLNLLDSNINIEFISTEPKPRRIRIAAKGRPATIWNAANGSSVKAVRSLIKNCKPGSDIKRLVMVGTLWTRDHQYKNPLTQLGLANPEKLVNLTSLKLCDYNCKYLPKDLFRSIDLSSVKEMAVVQCSNLHFLWELFLASRFSISITQLTVAIYDPCEFLISAHVYGFESFCKAFGTLTYLHVKACGSWSLDFDALKRHSYLRSADLDLGQTLPLEDLQKLQANHPELQELHYRDHDLASPLAAGEWHNDFKQKIVGTAQALAHMTELKYLRIIAEPMAHGKQRFNDVENNKLSLEKILATRIHKSITAAAEEGSVKCRIRTVVITEQQSLMFEPCVKSQGLTQGTVFDFPLEDEVA